MGLTRIELVTSSLSGTRSNQLSYKPPVSMEEKWNRDICASPCVVFAWRCQAFQRLLRGAGFTFAPEGAGLLRKEVIQPLVPQRLPCYDFIPITTHTLGGQMPDFGCRRLS